MFGFACVDELNHCIWPNPKMCLELCPLSGTDQVTRHPLDAKTRVLHFLYTFDQVLVPGDGAPQRQHEPFPSSTDVGTPIPLTTPTVVSASRDAKLIRLAKARNNLRHRLPLMV
jgi:hypothetical protein